MKQFTRRNSQQQHDLGSHTQKVKETTTFRLVEDTLKGSFPTGSDDPYSFKGDSQEPADIVQARQTAPQQNRQNASGSTASAFCSSFKRSAALELSGDKQKVATAGSSPSSTVRQNSLSGTKRGCPSTIDVKADTVTRFGSAAGSNLSKQPSGRSRGPQRSGQAAKSQLGRSASGGASRASAQSGGGRKKSKSSSCSPPIVDLSLSADSPAGCKAPQQRQLQQQANTPVSLPTPRRPTGLVRTGLLGIASVETRPAQTVMEAQERGELVQMQDDARYAMDGLVSSCSIETHRESAATLAEMLCSRKGRLALRADGLAQQVLTSLAKLKPGKDKVLGLASIIILLMLTSEDAHPAYLASIAAAVLFDQLLQTTHTLDGAADSCAQGAKLVRLLKSRPLCALLASTGVTQQRELLLLALEQATSSQQTSKVAAVERLKHNLRQYGALARTARLVAEAAADATADARQLRLLLLVLENATFTCQENGTALVQLQVTTPQQNDLNSSQEEVQRQPFPALLVQVANQLLGADEDESCQQALHVNLSVLMNLSHQNAEGAALIADAGGMQIAAELIGQLLAHVQGSHADLCNKVLQQLDLISVALGLLINLVSGEPANSRQLASTAARFGSSSADDVCDDASLVPLLCKVMTAVGELLQRASEDEQMEAGAATPPVHQSRSQAATAGSAHGIDDNSAGEASIVEAYCAMLLGFLVRDCEDVARCVPRLLHGQSLQPVVDAVQRCVSFYISAGAITDHTKNTLEELLQHLSKCV